MPREMRLTGLIVSWLVWTWATMALPTIRSSSNMWREVAVWAGFILGNYAYSQLWLAEGRARERERADQEKLHPPL
jgi:hypothetical protein